MSVYHGSVIYLNRPFNGHSDLFVFFTVTKKAASDYFVPITLCTFTNLFLGEILNDGNIGSKVMCILNSDFCR